MKKDTTCHGNPNTEELHNLIALYNGGADNACIALQITVGLALDEAQLQYLYARLAPPVQKFWDTYKALFLRYTLQATLEVMQSRYSKYSKPFTSMLRTFYGEQ